ncbi:16S rRNA (adenine(1518)-N(6)/adenine(1519)-N(6))-dimethyltransferase RsmA [Holdemania massiliensis]|uniref:16S rRNA (adenine(1518)-N(6)/adenine(1519)-N(6))- dimethyltransferase RsmA n=1 Tax=Holdemania massiliensis TaxID=1468449 RepID=UPI00267685A1|nr:16S rRNA (adenine(1518)-N(6)/adenine(1519)-N(6))-dimethyltransferase RsmA [Holdemania massiliensis]
MNKPIATMARTNEILEKYDLYAKKNFGQNFIIEPGIVEKIARLSKADEHSAVIEIGPGIGALTEQLAHVAGQVLAFEIDDRLIDVLADTLSACLNVTVVHQDFLEADLNATVSQLKTTWDQVLVCANLPYYITTPILFKIFESKADIPVITVMMQKEVADRFTASVSTKDYNALSVIVQYQYQVQTVMKIPKTIFNPRPAVDSAVVQFTKKQPDRIAGDEALFFAMVKGCFKQRRKTLYNNFREYLQDKEEAMRLLNEAGLEPSLRAETMTLDQFLDLYEVTYETKSSREN